MKFLRNLFACLCALGAVVAASQAQATTLDCGENTRKAAAGNPIPIGAVTSISLHVGQGDLAALAYFKCVNANGGIHGRPIAYHDVDDQGQLSIAVQAAKKLVDDEGVYVMVGSTSILECATNAAYYVRKNILEIGLGIPPQCYLSKNIAEINSGPRQTAIAAADFARRALGAHTVACVIRKIPGSDYICGGVEAWGRKFNVKVVSVYTDATSVDFPSSVLQAVETGADAAIPVMPGDQGIQFLAAVQAQDGAAKIKWLGPTTFYSDEFPRAIDGKYWNDRLWVNTELGDLGGDGKDNQNWLAVEKAYGGANDRLDTVAQGDYVAARVVVKAMLGIAGDINRDTVTAAIRNMAPYYSDILCSPWYWGGPDAPQHNPGHVSQIVTIEHGEWKAVEGCFPSFDPALAPVIATENKLGINKEFNRAYEAAK